MTQIPQTRSKDSMRRNRSISKVKPELLDGTRNINKLAVGGLAAGVPDGYWRPVQSGAVAAKSEAVRSQLGQSTGWVGPGPLGGGLGGELGGP